MIKLKTLITEQEFKAKSKETGRVVVYKSKDSMDKASVAKGILTDEAKATSLIPLYGWMTFV